MTGNRPFNTFFSTYIPHLLSVGLLIMATAAMYFASTESTMGNVQRIVYVHVPAAWFGVVAFIAMAICGALYLRSRAERWDHWSQASAEVGWLCLTLTILTGSLWAHAAWNTWWTWDPRLTAVFILWAITSAYLLLRSNLEDPAQSQVPRGGGNNRCAGCADDCDGNPLVSRHASGGAANGNGHEADVVDMHCVL